MCLLILHSLSDSFCFSVSLPPPPFFVCLSVFYLKLVLGGILSLIIMTMLAIYTVGFIS